MKSLFTAMLIMIGLVSGTSSNAQLTGNKSVPGDYPGIPEAIADLNSQGVGTGGVVFNIAAGHIDTASNIVISITSNLPTSANTVTFQKSGAGSNPLIVAAPGTSAFSDGIIKLSGADYITFDAIDIYDPNTGESNERMEWGYALLRASATDGTHHSVIKNCSVTLQKSYTVSVGIVILNRDTSGNVVVALDSNGQNNYNRIFGNNISQVYRGILVQSPSTSRDMYNEIGVAGENANMITNWGGSTVAAEGIRLEGQTFAKINNNVINGGAGTANAVAGIITNVFGTASNSKNYEVAYNQVTVSSAASSSSTYGIRALATGDSVLIHNNTVENCSAAQNTSSFYAITHDAVAASNYVYMYNNTVRNNVLAGTGSSIMIYGFGSYGKLIIRSNEIYGNQKTGASGSLTCIWASNSNVECDSNRAYNNSIPNSSGTSASSIYGYLNNNTPPTEYVNNNSFYNLTIGGSGTSASMLAVGIRINSAAAPKIVNNNLIHGINCVSGNTTTGGAYGIYSTKGDQSLIHSNKIYNIMNTGASGTAGGCWVSSGTAISIYNNFISDIKSPNSGSANGVFGINSTSTAANSSIKIYHNTVHLNASGGTSFGSAGLWISTSTTSTTAALDLRNNIIVNLSAPGSISGQTVAYRRSSSDLQNFSNVSNHNLFYCGAPSTNVLIFADGINSDQTINDYINRVTPREHNSRSVNVNFTNPSAGDLHLTGASIGDLNLVGEPVGISNDYDGDVRSSTYPYKGADETNAFTLSVLNLTVNLEACSPMQDTVRVQLRNTTAPFSIVDTASGYLSPTGTVSLNFPKALDGVNYYIVVRHRNSIETWSKSGGEVFASGVLNFNFTSAATQAFGNNMILVAGKYSFYTGDANQDGIVDAGDASLIDNDAYNFVTGYTSTDLNCDGSVDATDAAYADNNASNFVGVVRP
ncbi:MAG: hypothetical protein K1X85_07700 [Ignavibacteria bacterium]|nr:hypothetical protein [Ignavibacteria bacterium]